MLLLHYFYLQDTVFKCTRKFVFISGMMRVTDQEMTAIEKNHLLLTVPKKRVTFHQCEATWGSTRIGQKAEGMRGKHEQKALLWFS